MIMTRMFGNIFRVLRCVLNRTRETIAWCLLNGESTPVLRGSCSRKLSDLAAFVNENRNVSYDSIVSHEVGLPGEYSFVGAQTFEGGVAFIPNGSSCFALLKSDGSLERVWFDKKENEGFFCWTGGAIFDGQLVCFPRKSNDLLVLDLASFEVRVFRLGYKYVHEHHYGGAVAGCMVYQPPRGEDHVLCIDLLTKKAHRVQLAPKWLGLKACYCGSILHPNGLIYFLPENGRVVEFDPATERLRFIGKPVEAMAFGAAVSPKGDIYGFSGYASGILHIDPDHDLVEMVRTDIGCPGAYGTRLGINGLMYSVPGDGDAVLEFDPDTGAVNEVALLDEFGMKAKCAGSAMMQDGTIVFAPAFGTRAYLLAPNRSIQIPHNLNIFFNDCY